MIYLDTNVVIAFIDGLDPRHSDAHELLSSYGDDRVVSRLTLIELASVYSRAGLSDPLPLALYSIRRVKARIAEANFDDVFTCAFKLAPLLKLRTLDLLHIAFCKTIGAKLFITFDRDITSKSDVIRSIGIEVITK